MVTTFGMLTLDTVNDLKAAPTQDAQLVLVLGVTAYGDGGGGFYRFDKTSTAANDTSYYNVVAPTAGSGRWVRVFQRVRPIGAGGNIIVANGSFKMIYAPGTTDANGRVTVYLTDDGTATGNAIFSTIMQTAGEGAANVTDPNNMLIGARYSLSADRKTLVYQFARGNSSVISLLGATILGMRTAAPGSPVVVRIDGM